MVDAGFLRRFPALAEAAEKGMALARVMAVGGMDTEDDVERVSDADLQMRVVWENGKLLLDEDFATIRARAAAHLEH